MFYNLKFKESIMESNEKEKFCVNRKKKHAPSREELLQMDKEDLVDQILTLEAHNVQLKNVISKGLESDGSTDGPHGGRPFDFSKTHTRRILLRILYFGWDYRGLATQEDSTRTIEHELFRALTKCKLVEAREKAGYHRCGRTDKGVSSFGQVISLSVRSKFPPEQQNTEERLPSELPYCKMLNRLLPVDIRALCWMPIPHDAPDYSARFNCTKRSYKYYFPRGNLNLTAMSEGCKYLVGVHDFRNLCKMDVANGVTAFTRNVLSCEIVPVESDEATSMHCLCISGNAFLWHQIRCIMGVLLLVGEGREPPTVLRELLDVQKNPRRPQYNMALDRPLNLFSCSYDLAGWRWERGELSDVIAQLQGEWTSYSVKTTMIEDCLKSLEEQYRSLCDTDECVKGGTVENNDIRNHATCLLEGIRARTYKPMWEREKCSSLEERIEHYKKKRRIEVVSSDKK